MKIVVIGAVAAGTSVIAKARRNSEEVEIVCYTAGRDISYSGCGIPYYVGEDYISRKNLTPRDVKWFKDRFNVDIFTAHKVEKVIVEEKKILVKNEITGEEFLDTYDKLVITSGATRLQKLFRITIPSIKNTIYITALLRIIWVANSVDVIFNMTEGGPAYSSQTLSVYIFNKGNALNLGYASAMAILLALVLSVVAIPYLISTFREEDA